MLETIRQYGLEKLRTAGEESRLRSLHLEFFLHRVEQAEPKFLTDAQKTVLAEMDAEYGNVRAAAEWGMRTDAVTALRLTAALGQFWEVRGYISEGRGTTASP